MRLLVLAACAGLLATPLQAQTVLKQAPALDSPRATIRDAVIVLRDSLNLVDASIARLERDFDRSSDASIRSHAARLGQACARGERNVQPVQEAVRTSALPSPDKNQQRPAFQKALTELSEVLGRCRVDYGDLSRPGHEQELKAWALNKSAKVSSAVRRYEIALQAYLASLSLRILPTDNVGPSRSGQGGQ